MALNIDEPGCIFVATWKLSGPSVLPTRDEITRAFWHACRAAQRTTAEYLLDRGADPHWLGWDGKTPIRCAKESDSANFISWLLSRTQDDPAAGLIVREP